MTQDFAKKRRNHNNGGSRRSPSKSRPKSQVPGWVWLFTGCVLGAFIMFLIYLSDQPEPAPSKATKVASSPAKPAAKPNTPPKPRFDFYQLLEEGEDTALYQQSATNKPTAAKSDIEYLMQVGAFKNHDDADQLRAELLLMNLDAHIEEFKKRNNERYWRVLVGPYPDRSAMSTDRATLAGNKIDVWVITRKSEA